MVDGTLIAIAGKISPAEIRVSGASFSLPSPTRTAGTFHANPNLEAVEQFYCSVQVFDSP